MKHQFVALLLCALIWPMTAFTQAASPPPADKATVKPAAPQLTQDEIKGLDAVLEQATSVDQQLNTARLALESAENRANTIRANFEIARLRVCATRKLDPDLYEVVLVPVDLPNGAQAKQWTIRLRQSVAPPTEVSGGSAP